jgi:hypothetical protein
MNRTHPSAAPFSIALFAIGILAIPLIHDGCSKDDATKPHDQVPGLVLIEAEGYMGSHDGGGAGITTPSCDGASGQRAVEGIDFDGDWIEVGFTLSATTCFCDSLRGEGTLNDVRRFAILFKQGDSVVASDTVSTPPGKEFG